MLKDGHWCSEDYTQRMTTAQWKSILLDENDTVVYRGCIRQLKARRLGAGVLEIYKAPLKN